MTTIKRSHYKREHLHRCYNITIDATSPISSMHMIGSGRLPGTIDTSIAPVHVLFVSLDVFHIIHFCGLVFFDLSSPMLTSRTTKKEHNNRNKKFRSDPHPAQKRNRQGNKKEIKTIQKQSKQSKNQKTVDKKKNQKPKIKPPHSNPSAGPPASRRGARLSAATTRSSSPTPSSAPPAGSAARPQTGRSCG